MKNNVTVITGASSGIGKGLAEVFASNGHQLLLVARRIELLNEISNNLIKKYNISVHTLCLDLQKMTSHNELFEFCKSKNLSISYFVNNAGLGFYKPFNEHSDDEILNTLTLNITSVTFLSRLAVDYWIKENIRGSLLNVASVAAYVPLNNYVIYAASKSYVKNFSLGLRNEVYANNINVSCLCPGGTKTEFFETSKQKMSSSGEKMMMSSFKCAQIAYNGLIKNLPIIVPGFSNKLSVWLSRIFPEYFVIKYSTKIFNFFMEKN